MWVAGRNVWSLVNMCQPKHLRDKGQYSLKADAHSRITRTMLYGHVTRVQYGWLYRPVWRPLCTAGLYGRHTAVCTRNSVREIFCWKSWKKFYMLCFLSTQSQHGCNNGSIRVRVLMPYNMGHWCAVIRGLSHTVINDCLLSLYCITIHSRFLNVSISIRIIDRKSPPSSTVSSLTKVCDVRSLAIQLRTQQHLFFIFRRYRTRRSNVINNSSCLVWFGISILIHSTIPATTRALYDRAIWP